MEKVYVIIRKELPSCNSDPILVIFKNKEFAEKFLNEHWPDEYKILEKGLGDKWYEEGYSL